MDKRIGRIVAKSRQVDLWEILGKYLLFHSAGALYLQFGGANFRIVTLRKGQTAVERKRLGGER